MNQFQLSALYAGVFTLCAMGAWACAFAYLGFVVGLLATAASLVAVHYTKTHIAQGCVTAAALTLNGVASLRARFSF